jgi:hypothetical protein
MLFIAPVVSATEFIRVYSDDIESAQGSSDSGTGSGFTPVEVPNSNLGSFNISINASPSLSSNSAALAAFNRAAQQWMAKIADPVTINIDAGLAVLGGNTIGSTSSVFLQGNYATIRGAMVADGANETDDGITAFLPSTLSAQLPSGITLSGNMVATKANLKALEFTGLDTLFGSTDATITFNSNFNFDYDNTDGVGAGLVDFETVAAHEIGHALGFVSIVDTVDSARANSQTGSISPMPLDLYRFDENTASDPATNQQFNTFARELNSGTTSNFDEIANEWRMSTGVSTGDGRQASHWKDDSLFGSLIGIMDPTLPNAVIEMVSGSDLRALDLIGYEIVPEPSSVLLALMCSTALVRIRRRIAAR